VITLIAIRHLEIDGHRIEHGSEIKPGLLDEKTIAHLIDQRSVREYDGADRPSLYRLFWQFSGCEEKEELDTDEWGEYSLPP
jgi:hypothetical protein